MKTLLLFVTLFATNVLVAQVEVIKSYYNNGKLKSETPYVNKKVEGAVTAYHENGKVLGIQMYVNGKKEGKMALYYENGNIEEIGNYENAVLSGPYKMYYETGELRSTLTYVNDKMEGIVKVYYTNGKLNSLSIARAGKFEGGFEVYTKSEKLEKTGTYLNDMVEGIVSIYNDAGEIVRKDTYVNGKKIEGSGQANIKKEYYESGKLKKETPFVNEKIEGRVKVYSEISGGLLSYTDYSNNEKNGVFVTYYSGGSTLETGTYKNNKPIGVFKYYYYDGEIQQESMYIDGKLEGYVTKYKFDGTVESKVLYKDGKDQRYVISNFCAELGFILHAMDKKELDQLVDYNKPLGITRSWFGSKVNLTGISNLRGQNLLGNLSFGGYITASNVAANDDLYKDLVAQASACLSTSYNKEKESSGTGVKFTYEKNKKLYFIISYHGTGEYVELDFHTY